MKQLLSLFFLVYAINSAAQNVGIGNTNPAEKLDVTGNINVTGTIKANGVDGAPNQVLMKNSSGTLQWATMGDFKNLTSFYDNGTFTVPATVTKIAVEIWGAGGGGTTGVGGGGGGYVWAQLDVTPGNTANITIGNGGNGATQASAQGGESSSIVINGVTITAMGGGGAGWLSATTSISGYGGGFPMLIPGLKSYYGVPGTAGGYTKRTYQQYNATTFYESVDAGNGGMAYRAPSASGQGSYILYNHIASTTIKAMIGQVDGSIPGGGGAGGLSFTNTEGGGGKGGRGLVIVYY